MHQKSIRRWDPHATDLQDQFFAMRPRTRLLEKLTNGHVQDQDFMIIKLDMRQGRDQESCDFSLEP